MKTLYDIAITYVGTPYIWGGDDFSGYDCSGLVQEILFSVGAQPNPSRDRTAQELYSYFIQSGNHASSKAQLGAVVFYGTATDKVNHCAIMITRELMLEAAGGGSSVKTKQDAIDRNAYVKVRPLRSRSLMGIFLPHYHLLTPLQ